MHVSHIIMGFPFQTYGPLSVVVLINILCIFHSCTPHNSVNVWDIFMKLHRNVC